MNIDPYVVLDNLDILFLAIGKTLWITAISIVLGTILGFFIGTIAFSKSLALRTFARCYTTIFLAIPVLILMVWLYYSLPLISPALTFEPVTIAIVSLSLSLAAFIAQIFRSGMSAMKKGEIEVAYYLGFTRRDVLSHIIYPQVVHKMLPSMIGQYITAYKLTPLASIISVNDILHTANSLIAQTYRPIEIYTAVALLFLLTVVPLNLFAEKMELKLEAKHGKRGY